MFVYCSLLQKKHKSSIFTLSLAKCLYIVFYCSLVQKKSTDHLFLPCPFAKQVWQSLKGILKSTLQWITVSLVSILKKWLNIEPNFNSRCFLSILKKWLNIEPNFTSRCFLGTFATAYGYMKIKSLHMAT